MKNYLPKDYSSSANNFYACQDNDGRVFVANLNGILVYDGFNWSLSQSRDQLTVSALYKSSDNKIYYALEDRHDFGVFEQGEKGKFVYTSLLQNLNPNEVPTENIKQIIEFNNAVYFLSSDKIIEYKNNSFKVFNPINKFHIRSLKIGKHLFFVDVENGIQVLNNGVLMPVKNTQQLAKYKPWFSYKLTATDFAIGFRDIGVYKAKYDSINPSNTVFEKANAPCDAELIESEMNNGSPLKDGGFVVTSNKKGAFLINKNLEVVKRLNTKSGLFENNVKSAYEDKNGNLWLPNYSGVSFVEINSPLLKYGRENGISGPVQSACYYKNNLYIGTDKGLQIFKSNTNLFEDVLAFNEQVWFLLNYNGSLYICSEKGLFAYNGSTIEQISEESTSFLLNDPYQENVIYAATKNGIDVYHLSNKIFSFIKSYNVNDEVKSIASDFNKNIYFGTTHSGIFYLNYSNSYLIDSLKKSQGLPDDKRENFVFNYNNKLLIGTDDGIYAVSQDKNKKFFCKKDPTFYSVTKKTEIFRAIDIKGNLLCSQLTKLDNYDKYEFKYSNFKIKNNVVVEENGGLSKLKGVKPNLITYDTANKLALISTDEGLYLLSQQNSVIQKKYSLFLGSLINNKKDTFALNIRSNVSFKDWNISIPFPENNLVFKFGYNCFENPESIEFSYFLEGRDNSYSKWEKKAEIELSNLFEGKYILHAKAKNDISNEVIEINIPFSVSPPYYRSVYAYVIYSSLFLLFLYILIKLNTKRLKAQNVKLEGVIKQRTAVIEEQVHLLEHQKQEITDSINYAQRIQQSILPSFKEINETYENGFIFFQPKDIVSGDFYWFKKINSEEFLLACADCTGHGVPGAFMSMICSEKLSEGFAHSSSPEKILFYANNGIKEALRQNQQEEGKSKDGMEIALIRYNIVTKKISYSGANRPIWIIKSNTSNLLETKPTKASIASFTETNFEYELHEFVLETNDMVYLTTDGFPDQFGGPDGRKFMTKNMKTFLVGVSSLPIKEQEKLVSDKINSWMGTVEQVDDLLVIGLKA